MMDNLLISMLTNISYILLLLGYIALVIGSGYLIERYFKLGLEGVPGLIGGLTALFLRICILSLEAAQVDRDAAAGKWSAVHIYLVLMLRCYFEAFVPLAVLGALYAYVRRIVRRRREAKNRYSRMGGSAGCSIGPLTCIARSLTIPLYTTWIQKPQAATTEVGR